MPTVIICNPNALYYHHMVTYPNSFLLNLFLELNVNVMTWNYRGYGWTEGGMTSPYNLKQDAEQILNFLLNDLHLTGKIGVYGRSLGGIPSTHLAQKYPDIIKLLIADRTFGSIKEVAATQYQGKRAVRCLFDLITLQWHAGNDQNFYEAPCFKIAAIDPLDDIVFLFASLPVLSSKYACEKDIKSFSDPKTLE